jgi:hypothetical protein
MSEFIPQHTPETINDDFLLGYLDCAEWLLDEEIDRDKISGWSQQALKRAAEECASFERNYKVFLDLYYKISGRDRSSAGHDFYLSRNGHGAGFFDRGDEVVFEALQIAARSYGETNEYVWRRRIRMD